jgi:hypothetical protein
MKYRLTLDEFHLDDGELQRLHSFLEDKKFSIVGGIVYDFGRETNPDEIDVEDPAYVGVCGRFIDYLPWFNKKALHVIRGKRLEKVMKEYMQSQATEQVAAAAGSEQREV